MEQAAVPPTSTDRTDANAVHTRLAKQWRRRYSVAAILIYGLAFGLPVFKDTGVLANHLGVRPHGFVFGWQAFLVGWFAQQYYAWFSNVLVWLGALLLAMGRPLWAGLAGAAAFALGATYLLLLSEQSIVYPRAYLPGYYCWLASSALLTASAVGLRWIGPGRGSVIFASAAVVAMISAAFGTERILVAESGPPSDRTLIDRLHSADVRGRREAAVKLALRHKPEFVPILLEALQDPDDEVRQNAIKGLGKIGPAAEAAVPALIDVLRNPPAARQGEHVDRKLMANSRSAAAAALGSIGPAAKGAVPALAAALTDDNLPVRRWAASSLGEMEGAARSASGALLSATRDSDVQVRRDALRSLQKIGPQADAIPPLTRVLNDPDPTVRETAAAILKQLRQSNRGK